MDVQTSLSDHRFVHVTPAPILSRLEGLDDRMLTFVKMLPGVLQRRGIKAADVTEGKAQAQVYPARLDSQAFLAAFGTRHYIANDCGSTIAFPFLQVQPTQSVLNFGVEQTKREQHGETLSR